MGRKVAIYARVSTEHEAQINALGNQIQYYDNILSEHPDWELYDRYIDEGITGTSVKKRKNFVRMLEDAEKGCFDLIVTREVSRFARNTVDTLQETRKLKRIGVEVYFTEDNIWTFKDDDGELRLTLMATLAQNESRKTSQRVKAGQQISFENGVIYGTGNILGYDKIGKDFIINEEQAEIVRFIFKLFLEGKGSGLIKYECEKRGYLTATGLKKWSASQIIRMLQNPFYCGTIVYRKQFVGDYLEQKKQKNRGEVEQVIIEGTHEPIISKEDFNKVQEIIKGRQIIIKDKMVGNGQIPQNLWGKKLKCECGSSVQKRKYHKMKNGEQTYCFQCYKQIKEGSTRIREKRGLNIDGSCKTPMIQEWKLQLAANLIFGVIFKDRDEVVEKLYDLIDHYIVNDDVDNRNKEKLEIINKQIDEETKSLDKLLDIFLKGVIDEPKYVRKKEESEAILRKLIKDKDGLLEKQAAPKKDIEKRIALIKKNIAEVSSYADDNVSDEIIDEYTSQIIVREKSIDWHLSCLDELKHLARMDDESVQFAEIELSKKDVEKYMESHPQYTRLRLKDPTKIRVFL